MNRLRHAVAVFLNDLRDRPSGTLLTSPLVQEMEAALLEPEPADLYWDWDDREYGFTELSDMLEDSDSQVLRVARARHLSDIWVAFHRADDCGEDDYLEEFGTEADAVAAFEAEGHRRAMLEAASEEANAE